MQFDDYNYQIQNPYILVLDPDATSEDEEEDSKHQAKK